MAHVCAYLARVMQSADCLLCRRVALSKSGSNTQTMGTADAREPSYVARSTTASHSTNAHHIRGLLDSGGARLTRHSRDTRKEKTNSRAYDPTDIAIRSMAGDGKMRRSKSALSLCISLCTSVDPKRPGVSEL